MIGYLDTNVAAWTAQGSLGKLGGAARKALDRYTFRISPMVLVELEYLREIGRSKLAAIQVAAKLEAELGVEVCDYPFSKVAYAALHEKWTRDAFDRIIVAHARANASAPLLTADEQIHKHYEQAVWD